MAGIANLSVGVLLNDSIGVQRSFGGAKWWL